MDDVSCQLAVESDADEVLEFLFTYFLPDESISIAVNMSKDDAAPLLKSLISASLSSTTSFVARNGKGRLVAVRLSSIIDLDEKRKHLHKDEEKSELDRLPRSTRTVITFLDRLQEGVYEMLPLLECQKAIKFEIICVQPAYRRIGLAQRLMDLSIKRGQELGCTHVLVTATDWRSQPLFKKLGFQLLKVVKHENILDEHGNGLMTHETNAHEGWMMFKKL